MADSKFTHIVSATPVTQVAHSAFLEPNGLPAMVVCIRPFKLDFWEYEGTRAQLEEEGVIPSALDWPAGTAERSWKAGRFQYQLRRVRPRGMKGPMRLWTDGDCWNLRCELIDGPSLEIVQVQDMRRELEARLYRLSPEGHREERESFARFIEAGRDRAFQAFKTKILPQRKKPGRPSQVQA